MKKGYKFSEAVKLLRQGYPMTRDSWNDERIFIFMQVPAIVSKDTIPVMTSVPDKVKAVLIKRSLDLSYDNRLAIVYPDNYIYSYTRSILDIEAEDWEIFN